MQKICIDWFFALLLYRKWWPFHVQELCLNVKGLLLFWTRKIYKNESRTWYFITDQFAGLDFPDGGEQGANLFLAHPLRQIVDDEVSFALAYLHVRLCAVPLRGHIILNSDCVYVWERGRGRLKQAANGHLLWQANCCFAWRAPSNPLVRSGWKLGMKIVAFVTALETVKITRWQRGEESSRERGNMSNERKERKGMENAKMSGAIGL